MTDYTKLIERLREYKDYIPAAAEAAQAIEALRATQDRQSMQLAHDAVTIEGLNDKVMVLIAESAWLKSELDKAQDEINCAEASLEAFSCEFKSEVFNQGFDCLGDFVQAVWTASNAQRNTLRSKLDALQAQKPEPNIITKSELVEKLRNAGVNRYSTAVELVNLIFNVKVVNDN